MRNIIGILLFTIVYLTLCFLVSLVMIFDYKLYKKNGCNELYTKEFIKEQFNYFMHN